MRPMKPVLLVILMACLTPIPILAQPADGDWNRVPPSNLKAGAASAEITPPIGTMMGGYGARKEPSAGVYSPLEANVLYLDDGENRAVIVGLDTIGLRESDGRSIRTLIEKNFGVDPKYVLLNASHTHGGARMKGNAEYSAAVLEAIRSALHEAKDALKPASVGYGEGTADFNSNRRLIDENGKAFSGINTEGIVDQRIKVLRFDALDSGAAVEPMAVVLHVACHPNAFGGANLEFTGDFSGIGRAFLERNFGGKTAGLFLQGCAGDIRPKMPPLEGVRGWRHASEAGMVWCGYSFGAESLRVATSLRVRERLMERETEFKIRAATASVTVKADPAKIDAPADSRYEAIDGDGNISIDLHALSIGPYLFIALPGEPVVEYAFGIEEDLRSLGKKVLVLGYQPGDTGYIPVEHMIDEGGYEAQGPYYYGTEKDIRAKVVELATGLFEED